MAALPPDADQDSSEPLKYKTWVLKVSIHCEGCKRKVKRILHSVEGVYTIDVVARQHKVVVTGNVDANTLIRKLEKSGKHAELWLDFHEVYNKNQTNEQNPQPQQQQQQDDGIQNQNPNIIENQKVTFNVEEPQKNNNESQKVAENSGQPQQQVKEVRFEGNIAGEPQKPPANNPVGVGAPAGGGGGAKKKKKKKGHNGNNTANNPNNGGNNHNGGGDVAGVMEQGTNGGPINTESQPHPAHHPNPNPNPSGTRVYEYPPPYYAPPPVYAVSYNTAYPSSSYSASYYSAPPPYSYAYVHQGGDVEGPSPLDWNPHATVPPSDSFEIFSDENPNACAVM